MDQRTLWERRGFGHFGRTDFHFYTAWANSLARHLSKLGLEFPDARPTDALEALNLHLADLARQREEDAA